MKFDFPETPVPKGFAGPDSATPMTINRLYDFSGEYKILFGPTFKIQSSSYLVVAAAESLRFLRSLALDENVHALSIFEPLMFGQRAGTDISFLRYANSRNISQSLLEVVSTNETVTAASDLERYMHGTLLRFYPRALEFIFNELISLPSPGH